MAIVAIVGAGFMGTATAWPLTDNGHTVRLVGTDRKVIIREVERLLHDRKTYLTMSRAHNPYGDGKASGRIVRAIDRFLRSQKQA